MKMENDGTTFRFNGSLKAVRSFPKTKDMIPSTAAPAHQ